MSRATILSSYRRLYAEGFARLMDGTPAAITEVVISADAVMKPADEMMLILDVTGDEGDAIRQAAAFKERFPHAWVVLVAEHIEMTQEGLSRAIAAGISGYLRHPTLKTLVKALDLITHGCMVWLGTELAPRTQPLQCAQAKSVSMSLSERELTVLRLIVAGQQNKVIARSLGIAEATAKVHTKTIFRKLRVANRTQAALWAHANLPPLPSHSIPNGQDKELSL
jgi:two-component system nitrate/nitrite response regulator NarL